MPALIVCQISNIMIDILKNPEKDPDGMATYEYLVNHVDDCLDHMPVLIDNLRRVDTTGQFCASTARFLAAVDRERFGGWLPTLIEATIDKDRERRYIWSLLEAIWGADYQKNAEALKEKDTNFRRIYKRVYPKEGI